MSDGPASALLERRTADHGVAERTRTRAVRQIPEPARFWIAHSPRSWRCSDQAWTDLANGRLGGLQGKVSANLPVIDGGGLDDLFYLPPVQSDLEKARDELAQSFLDAGTPVLIQLRPGEQTEVAHASLVYDLLGSFLRDEPEELEGLPSGSTAVWPLIPGVSDHPEFWDEGLETLGAIGVDCVQPVAVDLSATDRRRLAEGRDEHVFDALFHGSPPSERAFARYADRHGLRFFMRRRRTGQLPRVENNRRLAADLALAGEIWTRLGRSVNGGQAFFRGARGAERTHHDLVALVREKNLQVMDWLDSNALEMARESVQEGSSSLLRELFDEYLGRVDPGTDDPKGG